MTKASKINRTIIVLETTLNPFKLDPSPHINFFLTTEAVIYEINKVLTPKATVTTILN